MSGLVHIIAYIKLPATFVYVTFDIYSRYVSSIGDNVELSLKLEERGVLISFDFLSMPTCCKTFFKYSFYVRETLLLALLISILSIFLASPRSFISNYWLSWSFNLSISSMLVEAMNISSTYKRRKMKHISYNWRKWTQFSYSLRVYLFSYMKLSNFLYHSLGDCFNPYKYLFNL